MIVPDSPGPRPHSDRRAAVRALGALLVAGLLAGCGSTVAGHPTAARQTAITRRIGVPLADLLPGPDRFPARYAAVVLSPEQARRAAADLAGVPPGAQADPAECVPPQRGFDTDRTAVVVGTDDGARATLTVELSRAEEPLARLREQLRGCELVRVQHGPVANAVVTQLDPPPSVDADDALALHRTVSGPVSGPGLTQSMHTELAQIGDVRINATYLSFDGRAPDGAALAGVFGAAVDNVRKS
ncbi:DUF5642 family protein [Nocardia sp. BMG51109]|uniref:DUF5642 family protein n=1 Tax=Nocardia sp. BMG51109 TaxID=1056816 RepID=UPI0004679BC4|nr:DUF5642 family protein [Nocardia sp. BMG51109]